jgi:hypothetical protein
MNRALHLASPPDKPIGFIHRCIESTYIMVTTESVNHHFKKSAKTDTIPAGVRILHNRHIIDYAIDNI